MAKITVPLSTASLAQLKEYAGATLGIDMNQSTDETEIRAQIMIAAPGVTELTVTAVDVPVIPTAQPQEIKPQRKPAVTLIDNDLEQSGRNDAVAVIEIQVGSGKNGQDPVYVSVNGTSMLIPRGKQVPIPYRYYNALRHATRIEYEQITDDRGNPGPLLPRQVPEYPVSLIRIQTPAEAA